MFLNEQIDPTQENKTPVQPVPTVWITLKKNPRREHLPWQTKLIRKIPLRDGLVRISASIHTRIHTMALILRQNLLLDPISLQVEGKADHKEKDCFE